MLTIFLILIFIRPFISSLAFPYLNLIYSSFLMGFLVIWSIIKGISLRKISFLKYPLILLCLALIISIVFSPDKLKGLKEIYKYISGILIFLIAASLSYADKMRVIRTIILAGLTISLLAVYQYLFGFTHIMDYISKKAINDSFVLDYIARKRVYFPFVTPNALAGYLAIIIPLTLIYKDTMWLIILLSFSLLLTKSLGAFFSIFLGMGLYLYLRKDLHRTKIILLGLLGAALVFVFILRQTQTKEHILPAFSLFARIDYWQATCKIIQLYPFTGVGLGNFNLPLSRYAHNSYLQIWAEMGIPGIISVLWLIASAFKSGLENINDSADKNQILALFSANTIFLMHNFVDFTFFLPEVAVIWWIILGSFTIGRYARIK